MNQPITLGYILDKFKRNHLITIDKDDEQVWEIIKEYSDLFLVMESLYFSYHYVELSRLGEQYVKL